MKTDIIIAVWNQFKLTRDCIESIFAKTDSPFHLILIDNASSEPTKGYLERLAEGKKNTVTLIRNETNLGFIKASNRGIKKSTAPYICLLNNDTEVTKGWLEEMIKVADKRQDIGIVNSNSNTLGCRAGFGRSVEALAEKLKSFSGEYAELAWATGFCMLIKREVINKAGLLDEIYGMGTFEDADFSKRAQRLGYSCVCAKASYVYHKEKRSFIKLRKFRSDFDRNREIFYSKWGRQERILYVLSKEDIAPRGEVSKKSMKLARDGNIVWIFLNGSGRQGIEMHSNIYVYNLPSGFFNLVSLWRILKRKKKFDKIYVDDENYWKRLKRLGVFHKAEVIQC